MHARYCLRQQQQQRPIRWLPQILIYGPANSLRMLNISQRTTIIWLLLGQKSLSHFTSTNGLQPMCENDNLSAFLYTLVARKLYNIFLYGFVQYMGNVCAAPMRRLSLAPTLPCGEQCVKIRAAICSDEKWQARRHWFSRRSCAKR